jgi:hypothetical protein
MEAAAIVALFVVAFAAYGAGLRLGIGLARRITLVPPPRANKWTFGVSVWAARVLVVSVVMLIVSTIVWTVIVLLSPIA